MDKLLSLVVPVFNEEECILEFISQVRSELDDSPLHYEIVFADDGSTDNTVELIRGEIGNDSRIRLVELSYNHGKQAALTAAVTYSNGDYLIYMDPDLQDPPKEISRFIAKIEEGYDLVFGVRESKEAGFVDVLFSKVFWLILDVFTGLKLPRPLAVMRIFNREFANRFLSYKESNRFIEGIFMHIGMRQATLKIKHRPRFAGVSKYNFARKLRLAKDAILDYSELPLKLATRFGIILVITSLLAVLTLTILRLFFIDFQLGWPSLICTLWFGFGINLLFLGVIGSYVGKIYSESKHRPLFSTQRLTNIKQS